jgi:hypothetical protein
VIKIFRALLFFPSVTFGLVNAEVFPWALGYFAVKFKKISSNNLFALVNFYLGISVLYSLFLITFESRGSYIELIRSIFAYLNSMLIFIYILSAKAEEIKPLQKLIFWILGFQICLGLFQYYNLIDWLQPILSFLTPRAISFGGGYRGATLLSSEPSRAATEFTFIAFLVYILMKKNYYRLYLLVIILIFNTLIFKSLDGLILNLMAIVLFFKFRALFLLTIICLTLYFFSDDLASSSRLFQFIQDLKSQSSVYDLFTLVMNNSGFRVSSILSSFYYGLLHIFGSGIGQWQISSIEANELIGFDPSKIFFFLENGGIFIPLRPSSYVANLMLDIGLVGTFLVLAYIKNLLPKQMSSEQFAYVSLFIFSLFFISSVGNPVPWICCAIAVRQMGEEVKCKNQIAQ